ncbi:MAG: tRNA dihydrouridine synthase DusB [Roseitalea sp.]|jgi:nifR3 family TIM-barrel protein|nr:tRNA dihydrouridine synthase DusB [Roseitalea sp.]MBO6722342.1 tRNA dihydrouridine synthase DusB [Roseitalea sp.]MBO6744345.1 tRNA dihydrouridine synthase DusB [Roseitalea sp.]
MPDCPKNDQSDATERLGTPLAIGPVALRNRVFLAPMSGISDAPFRKLAYGHGAGLVVSEMIASREFCQDHAESRKRAARHDGQGPFMLQLAGREARWMGEAARIAEGNGADIIDINMGCPAKKVTSGLSGSALMRDLDHAMTLIEATVTAVNVPVTLKMRLGWDETSINAPELARRAEAAGVRMITVHGRTRAQFYDGVADWHAVAAVRAATTLPLVVNGDIADRASAQAALDASGADAVMIGRAACGRPWLAGAIAGQGAGMPAPETIGAYVLAHYDAMLDHYGAGTGVRHARKHLGWYLDAHARHVAGLATRKGAILRERDADAVKRQLAAIFAEVATETQDLAA